MGGSFSLNLENSTYEHVIDSNNFFKSITKEQMTSRIKKPNNVKYIKILSLEDLKGINEKCLEKNNELISKFRKKNECSFQKERSFHLDIVGYYKSYHLYEKSYGIYINISKFLKLYLDILDKCFFTHEKVKEFAMTMVLEHCRFHYLTEILSSMYEIETGTGAYSRVYSFYKKNYATSKCIEEILANYFINITTNLTDAEIKYLHNFIGNQIEGYKEALYINKNNEIEKFKMLEQLIGYKEMKYSKILSQIMYLPLASYSIHDKLNIPIYIVDDTNDIDEFRRIKEMLFPNIDHRLLQ